MKLQSDILYPFSALAASAPIWQFVNLTSCNVGDVEGLDLNTETLYFHTSVIVQFGVTVMSVYTGGLRNYHK